MKDEQLPKGLCVRKDASGTVWLNIESPSGKKASINLVAFGESRGGIVGAALLEWCEAMPTSVKSGQSQHE